MRELCVCERAVTRAPRIVCGRASTIMCGIHSPAQGDHPTAFGFLHYSKELSLGNQPLETQRWILPQFLGWGVAVGKLHLASARFHFSLHTLQPSSSRH